MNRVFQLVWNTRLFMCVPAHETGPGRGRGFAGFRNIGALALSTMSMAGYGLPIDGQVTAGQGSIAQSGSAMTINQQSGRLAINWQSFGIGAGESVSFVQPGTSAIALNRVLGSDVSQIYGRLSANGQVWLLNPNGVLFGGGAQVNVGGLLASTLDISDADFLAGRRTFAGGGAATVANFGAIGAADGGYVALLGGKVSNEGTIQARLGTVALGAGQQITLDFAGDKLLNVQVDQGAFDALAQNRHLIRADAGTVLLTSRAASDLIGTAVNNTGVIEARTVETHNGTIKLLGGAVQVAGTLDASAPNGGDGGLIETSGARVRVVADARVTTAAPQGRTGQWLINPTNFTIAGNGGDISGAALGNQLQTTNVTIVTRGGGDTGDVSVNGDIVWNSSNALTLSAYHGVRIVKRVSNSGAGAITLRADNAGTCVSGAADCGTISFAPQGGISVNGGTVNLYYNPSGSNRPADSKGNGPSYASPTDYSSHVTLNAGSTLGAWMLVNDVNQLQAINTNLAGQYALGRDVDASATSGWNAGAGFVPLGTPVSGFAGSFDGLDKTITALTINRPQASAVGLFGRSDGHVDNVSLESGAVTGDWRVGSLVGHNTGSIRNSHITGTATTKGESAGGLVGFNEGSVSDSDSAGSTTGGMDSVGGLIGFNTGTVTGSHSTADVFMDRFTTTHNVGGLIGSNTGTVARSYFSGNVFGGHVSAAGGLIGSNAGSVNDSYNTGTVQGYSRTGGLIGANSGPIAGSYSTGQVNGAFGVGGLVGSNDGTLEDSYSTGAVSGSFQVGGLIGANAGTVRSTYSTGAVSATQMGDAGGLVGSNAGSVSNSYSTGNVTGYSRVGGLIGYNSGALSESYSTGGVRGYTYVGGLVGSNSGTVSDAYGTGEVYGFLANVGGLVGTNTGVVTTSYSTGPVSAGYSWTTDVGGLVGGNTGTVTSSYWDVTTSGQSTSAGGTGLNDTQMRQKASFAGFEFMKIWDIEEGVSYPFLKAH